MSNADAEPVPVASLRLLRDEPTSGTVPKVVISTALSYVDTQALNTTTNDYDTLRYAGGDRMVT